MRLWHKDLIPVLPRQQLIAQYRECVAIARNISINGTPNHLLVNKVMEYPWDHFYTYTKLIHDEMVKRGYKCNFDKFTYWMQDHMKYIKDDCLKPVKYNDLFADWHNGHYLLQCYYNLQEKYDCGGVPDDEWKKLYVYVMKKGCRTYEIYRSTDQGICKI